MLRRGLVTCLLLAAGPAWAEPPEGEPRLAEVRLAVEGREPLAGLAPGSELRVFVDGRVCLQLGSGDGEPDVVRGRATPEELSAIRELIDRGEPRALPEAGAEADAPGPAVRLVIVDAGPVFHVLRRRLAPDEGGEPERSLDEARLVELVRALVAVAARLDAAAPPRARTERAPEGVARLRSF